MTCAGATTDWHGHHWTALRYERGLAGAEQAGVLPHRVEERVDGGTEVALVVESSVLREMPSATADYVVGVRRRKLTEPTTRPSRTRRVSADRTNPSRKSLIFCWSAARRRPEGAC